MPGDIEWESFAVISTDSLLVYNNKYYPQSILRQLCSENYKQTNHRLSWWQSFWRLDIINAELR